MGIGSEFPAFVKLEMRNDGSARTRFLSEVDNILSGAEARFGRFSTEAQRQLDQALSVSRNSFGSLDLGVPQLRAAAAAQQTRATAARELADATAIAARANGDLTRQTQLAIAAASGLAHEEEQAAKRALAHANAAEEVQRALNRQASATDAVAASTRRGSAANDNQIGLVRTQRVAMAQLGQQLQDVAVQYAAGTAASTIFAQQSGQVAFALSGLEKSSNRTLASIGSAAAFMSGPWGGAIAIAVAALGPFVARLFEAGDAADSAKFATNAMGDAQGILGNILDLTTGRIETQSTALLALAQAQILVARVQAQTRAAEARSGVQSIQDRPVSFTGGGLGGGFAAGRRAIDARDTISRQVLEGTLDGKTAVERLENLRRVGRLTDEEFTAAATSVANLGVELENLKVLDQADALLNGRGGRELLKPGTSKKRSSGAADRELKQLKSLADSAAESIAKITSQFDEQPKAIDRVSAATRELDKLIDQLADKNTGGRFDAQIAKANEARALVETAIDRQIAARQNELSRDSERQYAIQALIVSGREAEAEALQRIWRIEEGLKPLSDERRKAILAEVEAEQRKIDALERQRELQNAYLDASRSIQTELQGFLSGRGFSFKNITQSFRDLQGKVLFDQLFGQTFKDLEKRIKQETGLTDSVDTLITENDRTSSAMGRLADVVDRTITQIGNSLSSEGTVARSLEEAFDETFTRKLAAANDNIDPNQIVVMGQKPSRDSLGGLTPERYAEIVSRAITKPLTESLDSILGIRFFAGLSGVLSGALRGYAAGGPAGAALGLLSEIPGLPQGLKGALGAGYGGLVQGDLIGRLMKEVFGKTMSGGGAQAGGALASIFKLNPTYGAIAGALVGGGGLGRTIGGAAGGVLGQLGGAALGKAIGGIGTALGGPVGAIVGTLLGSLIGGLFGGKVTKGYTVARNGTATTGGNNSQIIGQVSQTGNGINDSLKQIAQALGGTLGNYSVSIGQRSSGWIRVSASGSSRVGDQSFKDAGRDLIYNGKSMEDAVRIAISNAIKDGAIAGVSAATQRLLQKGGDIDAQVQKAVDLEAAFKRLRQYKNPVGTAIDQLNAEFTRLKAILTEAGGTAAEFAQLQELYTIQRTEAIKEATERLTGSLKGLLDELTIGNDSLSLRDRKSAAEARYNPLAARLRAGDATAYDDFVTAARDLLGIERQISGSQTPYFTLQNEITELTRATLNQQQALIDAATGSASPFAAQNQVVVSAVNNQTDVLAAGIRAVNDNLATIGRMFTSGTFGTNPRALIGLGYY